MKIPMERLFYAICNEICFQEYIVIGATAGRKLVSRLRLIRANCGAHGHEIIFQHRWHRIIFPIKLIQTYIGYYHD